MKRLIITAALAVASLGLTGCQPEPAVTPIPHVFIYTDPVMGLVVRPYPTGGECSAQWELRYAAMRQAGVRDDLMQCVDVSGKQ
jgi:hypothetical protein